MGEDITSHICSALILFNPSFSASYQFVFLHVKSKAGCHRRQLACLRHMIEVAAIYNVPAGATHLTYLRPAPLPMPFHSANEDESCGFGYFVKSRGTVTNLHYPSSCRAWSFSPGAKLLQTCLSSKLSVYLSRPGSSQGGCYHKGPICYPGFTPSQKPLFGTFIYQEKAVNVSKKVCTLSLCH